MLTVLNWLLTLVFAVMCASTAATAFYIWSWAPLVAVIFGAYAAVFGILTLLAIHTAIRFS